MSEASAIGQRLQAAVVQGVAPALAFGIQHGERRWTWYAGQETPAPDARPCDAATRFDLASLTKPFTTLSWALRLASAGRLDLHGPIGQHREVADARLAACPLWRLLAHSSGLPAWRPFFEGLKGAARLPGGHARARAAIHRMLSATPLETPPGVQERYSDLGYLLVEWILEGLDGPLAERWPDLPGHGPEGLYFRPLPIRTDSAETYAATEDCPWRGGLLRGEVHDDNTWVMGGVAGHAGLFGTLEAALDLGAAWCAAARGEARLAGIDPRLSGAVSDPRWGHPQGSFLLGWDTPSPGISTAGKRFRAGALGHLGFTGTSLWMEPAQDVCMVLLSNRVCPSRSNQRHRPFRPALHDQAWALLGRP